MARDYSNAANNQKNGRYVLGGVTETSPGFLEWWERKDIVKDVTDTVYYLEAKYEGRPDLLAYVLYGDPGLWWIVPQFNDILDPEAEMVAGKALLIPSAAKVEALKEGVKVGGIATTRT